MDTAIVRTEQGRLWLNTARLRDKREFESFDLVELEGVMYELQGKRQSDGWWWIERVDVADVPTVGV